MLCSYKDDEFVVNENQTMKLLRLQIEKKMEQPRRYGWYGKGIRTLRVAWWPRHSGLDARSELLIVCTLCANEACGSLLKFNDERDRERVIDLFLWNAVTGTWYYV